MKQEGESFWDKSDKWLSRVNHVAQIGILAFAVFGYFHTVVPLYEKAVVDEALAKAQIQLQSTEKRARESYIQLRAYFIRELIFGFGMRCTSLGALPEERDLKHGSLDIDTEACLRDLLSESRSFSYLNESDRGFISLKLNLVAKEIDELRKSAILEYENLSNEAKTNRQTLPKLSESALMILGLADRGGYSNDQIERAKFEWALRSAEYDVLSRFQKNATNLIAGSLKSLEWPTN